MVYPPGQGKSGHYLMQLWRRYLEQYADHEGSAEEQVVVASYHAAEVFGLLALTLDRQEKYLTLTQQRISFFDRGSEQARVFADCLVNGTFSLYNHINTLAHLLTDGNPPAADLIRDVDQQVHSRVESAGQTDRAAAALAAAFPLLSLVTIALDRANVVTEAIRQVEQRFIGASAQAVSAQDRLLNGLYRMVEMMQLFVALSDQELVDQALQIAARFQEEDRTRDPMLKMRNGFCRLFELGHLVTTHLDEIQ
jgi:hypothetical protein